MPRLLSSALRLAAKGMAVFPCHPHSKLPATKHGLLDASKDAAQIESWWGTNPNCNVAIVTGAASGVFVIDIDSEDGEAALRKLEAVNGTLPGTVEAITARGRHVYFKMPCMPMRNSAGKLAPGLDIRATGGFVLVPPSVHPSGRRYAWSVDSGNAIAEAPAWLLSVIASSAGSNGTTSPSEWRRLAADGVAEGARNDSIAKLTGHLLRRYVDPRIVLELIRTWNAMRCRPPLADREIEQIVNSIAGKELKRRQEAGHGR